MIGKDVTQTGMIKFAGVEVLPSLKRKNYFFLYFNTFLGALVLSSPALFQPAFLSEVINIQKIGKMTMMQAGIKME